MPTTEARRAETANAVKTTGGRLFVLDLSGGRVLSIKTDGSDKKVIVDNCPRFVDGIAVNVQAGHIYWSNMGVPTLNDGSIERADLDGKNRRFIIPVGGTHTPKQIHLDKESGKLYWSDREGMRVMRASLDGTVIETLVDTSGGDARPGADATKWCVGITVDPKHRKFYWTQKGPTKGGTGTLRRANIDVPKGQTAANRTDIEVLFENLPEPIDLELDLEHRVLYWTDRGDPPRGNSVSRAPIDTHRLGDVPEVVLTHLMEAIGVALDVPGDRMFVTDLAGDLYTASLDGSGKKGLLMGAGNLTGIAYVR
jgi:hypothetical protein